MFKIPNCLFWIAMDLMKQGSKFLSRIRLHGVLDITDTQYHGKFPCYWYRKKHHRKTLWYWGLEGSELSCPLHPADVIPLNFWTCTWSNGCADIPSSTLKKHTWVLQFRSKILCKLKYSLNLPNINQVCSDPTVNTSPDIDKICIWKPILSNGSQKLLAGISSWNSISVEKKIDAFIDA